MSQSLQRSALREEIERYFREDDLGRNLFYTSKLPNDEVDCRLLLKTPMVLAGLPWLIETFHFLGAELPTHLLEEFEGKKFDKHEINFKLPFDVALTGERIALNLLQKASSIASFTEKFVEKAKDHNIAILDTRKTTPGMRALEKYAVRCGGGFNHRLGQTDLWMVKDNHKNFFGGVKEAVEFFRDMNGFYTPMEVEIHDLKELAAARELGIKHLMLDNFSPDAIREAISQKDAGVTYEVSGGVTLDTVENYLIDGVDAISIGSLTYGAPPVDISLKYERA